MKKLLVLCIGLAVVVAVMFNKQHNNKEKASIIIGLTGDVMLGRLVNDTISKKGYAYPWGNMLPSLHATDLNIINLETTLTKSTDAVPKVFNFKADPDKVQTLKEARIDIVTLANNHSRDFGDTGLQETITILDAAGILHVGAGLNTKDAHHPVIITKKDICVGVIGFTDNEPDWKATEIKPGTNYVHIPNDNAKIIDAIKKLRPQVDILVVTFHWGPNMREYPSQEFIEAAHAMVDAGADIIHGHSSHVFQGIEVYRNKLILYDTGDFVDDYVVDPILRNDQSNFYLIYVTEKGIEKLKLIPIIINNMQVNRASGLIEQEIINRVKKRSVPFGTKIIDNIVSVSST